MKRSIGQKQAAPPRQAFPDRNPEMAIPDERSEFWGLASLPCFFQGKFMFPSTGPVTRTASACGGRREADSKSPLRTKPRWSRARDVSLAGSAAARAHHANLQRVPSSAAFALKALNAHFTFPPRMSPSLSVAPILTDFEKEIAPAAGLFAVLHIKCTSPYRVRGGEARRGRNRPGRGKFFHMRPHVVHAPISSRGSPL